MDSMFALTAKGRTPRLRILLVILSLVALTVWNLSRDAYPRPDPILGEIRKADPVSAPSGLSCRALPGANDTLIILKTGSTELKDKLPIHLMTTFRCYPNHIVFSDYEELFQGEHILDALDDVSSDTQSNHKDFELHRRLHQSGRAILDDNELSGKESEKAKQWVGKEENPGWKLDKWKFLPMVKRTLSDYPYMKWYVFVEADTYVLWASLLQYLAVLDHTKPYYAGSQMYIGDCLFAHGGSGFIISQPAMRMVVDHYEANKSGIEAFTDSHWAGDCVLGRALQNSGVKFTDAWPIIQGDYPGTVAYARPDGRPIADPNKRIWCYPSVSYHHASPDVIADIWDFEQKWIASSDLTINPFLRHKDVFTQYIMPQTSAPRDDWDNESDSDRGTAASLDACRAMCEADLECRQWSFDHAGLCKNRVDPRLGKPANGTRSGWMHERVIKFAREMAPCGEEGWMI